MRASSRWSGLACGAVVMMVASSAQADDVSGWIALIEKQPAGVDRAAWKEQRRDAARKLLAAKDKRALAVFLQLADSETFDIIGEIAIEGLGSLGDPQAVPTLERIAADASRDRTQRDLAKKALTKLGSKPTKPPPPPPPPVDTGTPPTSTPTPTPTPPVRTGDAPPVPSDVGQALLGDGNGPGPVVVDLPTFGDDVLAATESVTLAAGVATLGYDTVRDRLAFDLDVAGRYRRRLDRERMAWAVDGGARVIAATLDPDGPVRSRAFILDADATGEVRFYAGAKLYGLGTAAFATQVQYLGIERETDPATRDARFASDLQLGLGGGYGRVLDVGGRLRIRELERRLRRDRSLGRPIDDALAAKLQATWWALRRDRTGYRQLAATVALLREAGVLLGEPLSATTYELLEVLRDPSFDARADGFDVHLIFGEGYLLREDEPAVPEGRIEMVLVRARLAKNLGLDSDVGGHLDARYRILAPEGTPAPWRIALGASWRRFVHGDHAELLGGLDVGGELVASDDDLDTTDLGLALGGTVGWSATFNRASRIRVGADARIDAGEIFLGASLTASYGWLDAGFARGVPTGL